MAEVSTFSNQALTEKTTKTTFWQKIKASLKGESHHGKPSPVFSREEESLFSHTPTILEKDTHQSHNNAKEHHMTTEFKKEMLGEAFYEQITTKKISHKSPQVISEDLKREILGDKLYSRNYKKGETLNSAELNKYYEQDISISQKPPSRGRKR